MKNYLSLLLLLALSGCCSVRLADLNPSIAPNSNKLPFMEISLSTANLHETYTSGTTITSGQEELVVGGSAAGYAKPTDYESGIGVFGGVAPLGKNATSSLVIKSDKRVQDATSIFTKEAYDNLMDLSTSTEPRGYLVLNINTAVCDQGVVWPVLSKLTLCTFNLLLAMPYSYRSEEVDVTVCIYNGAKQLVKRYVASGQDTEYVAMYYGYNGEDAARLAAAQALKSALEKIRVQINADAYQLKDKLN